MATARKKAFKNSVVPGTGAKKKVRFGHVTITVDRPSPEARRRNVKAGQDALERLRTLAKPGVDLPFKKGVPYYWADPKDPRRIVRVLNGKKSYGTFAGGVFKTAKA